MLLVALACAKSGGDDDEDADKDGTAYLLEGYFCIIISN